MRHHEPRDDEVEEENRIDGKSFAVRRLTVAHKNDRRVRRPSEAGSRRDQSKEKCEVGLCNEQNRSTDDQSKRKRSKAVAKNTHRLEERSEKKIKVSNAV